MPVLTPKLSSYWVTSSPRFREHRAAAHRRACRNEIIVRDDRAGRLFPTIQPLDYRTAVKLALEKLNARSVESA